MPTYEYECKKCGKVIEIFQSITASPLRKARCEHCDAERAVRRLIGVGGALIFKGSGFYETDYRSEAYKNAAKGESPTTDTKDVDSKKNQTDKCVEPKTSSAPAAESTLAATPVESKTKRPQRRRKT